MFAHFISRHPPWLPLLLYSIVIGLSYKGGEGWNHSALTTSGMLSLGSGCQDPHTVALQGPELSRCGKGVTQNILISANLSQMKHLCLVCNISCVTSSCCILFCRGCSEPQALQARLRRALLLKTAFWYFSSFHRARLSGLGMNKNFLPCFSSPSLQVSQQTWAQSAAAFLLSRNIY